MEKFFEKIKAKKYYGSHSIGTVFLINGQPHHTLGKDTIAYEKKLIEIGYQNIEKTKENSLPISKIK